MRPGGAESALAPDEAAPRRRRGPSASTGHNQGPEDPEGDLRDLKPGSGGRWTWPASTWPGRLLRWWWPLVAAGGLLWMWARQALNKTDRGVDGYDFSRSTAEVYACQSCDCTGKFAAIRRGLDYTYHTNFATTRQEVQGQSSQVLPWMDWNGAEGFT
jgi:hypothetical protein